MDSSVWFTLSPQQRKDRARHAAEHYALDDLSAMVEAYLAVKKASTLTQSNYRSRLKGVVDYLESQKVNILDPHLTLGIEYLQTLAQSDLAYESARASATTMRVLYEALCWAGTVMIDPFMIVDITRTLKELTTSKSK